MATVTETYIQEQNEGDTQFPSACLARFENERSTGAIVSRTVTPIVDSAEVVTGKTRANVVIVFKSEEDRTRIANDNLADATMQAYLTSSAYRKINRVIS
jgi:hypothetical protein